MTSTQYQGRCRLNCTDFIYNICSSVQLREKSLYPPDGFKLGITRGTSDEAYFKNHVEEEFRKIYQVNLKIHLLDSFQEGIDQLMNKLVALTHHIITVLEFEGDSVMSLKAKIKTLLKKELKSDVARSTTHVQTC